jgi:MOSC domain-containing protein
MSHTTQTDVGSVASLWQYPVKSMMGEELNATEVTERGLLGDRAYALVDSSDGKVATAKNPRKWPRLFDFRATFIEPARVAAKVPPVRIALPDGTTVTSDQGDLNQILSKALSREVTLGAAQRGAVTAEEYWPDMEGLDHRDTVTDFILPEETFFDCAMVHLLTTATLDRLRELYPQGRFEVRRFRPNIAVQLGSSEKSFAENA